MSEQNKLVIVNSRGFDDERSSVAWSIANTAAASNMDVTVFLVAAGVDFLIPVYWGVPGKYSGWSFVGLPEPS